jgi:Kinase non-catalytic C-lobe domain
MAGGGESWSGCALDPGGCLSLQQILHSFSAPISEEHAWALIHQVRRLISARNHRISGYGSTKIRTHIRILDLLHAVSKLLQKITPSWLLFEYRFKIDEKFEFKIGFLWSLVLMTSLINGLWCQRQRGLLVGGVNDTADK